MKNPKVAIVIVTWNKRSDVLGLLDALKRLNYDSYDIIVVDNASTDGSAEDISRYYPEVCLIVNKENLGGTGGFNTGMSYVLKKTDYKYIWLLDNDAMVESDTLRELVVTVEEDDTIGLAGSLILNPENKHMIVELGSFVYWKGGTWRPYLRNSFTGELPGNPIVPVDYVAACSALVRIDAVRMAGIMDGRYFLHWDDIDFSLGIKKAGYKIVAVSRSRVYHGVEKGINPSIIYYDVRNGLLAISKHRRRYDRFIDTFSLLRMSMKWATYSCVSGMQSIAKLLLRGVQDFITGHFYKMKIEGKSSYSPKRLGKPFGIGSMWDTQNPKIIIFPNGTSTEIQDLITQIRSTVPRAHIALLIQNDRLNLFKNMEIDAFLPFDSYRQSITQNLSVFVSIWKSRYDCAISPHASVVPYSYAVRKYYLYNKQTTSLSECNENIYRSWKLFPSIVLGEVLSFVLWPVVYVAGSRYGTGERTSSESTGHHTVN